MSDPRLRLPRPCGINGRDPGDPGADAGGRARPGRVPARRAGRFRRRRGRRLRRLGRAGAPAGGDGGVREPRSCAPSSPATSSGTCRPTSRTPASRGRSTGSGSWTRSAWRSPTTASCPGCCPGSRRPGGVPTCSPSRSARCGRGGCWGCACTGTWRRCWPSWAARRRRAARRGRGGAGGSDQLVVRGAQASRCGRSAATSAARLDAASFCRSRATCCSTVLGEM